MAKGMGRGLSGLSGGGGSKCGRCCSAFIRRVRSDLLLVLIIIGVVIGFVIGALVNGPVNEMEDMEDKKTVLMLIGFAGELFMNMLKMLILPLIVASLICALAALDAKATGRVGRRALVYYLSTTILAVILGIVLVVSIRPGNTDVEKKAKDVQDYRTLDAFLDLIRYCSKADGFSYCYKRFLVVYNSSPFRTFMCKKKCCKCSHISYLMLIYFTPMFVVFSIAIARLHRPCVFC